MAYPELDGLKTNDQLAGALAVMQRQSPERHAQLAMHVQRVIGTLKAAETSGEQQARQQRQQQAFRQYADFHDGRAANATSQSPGGYPSPMIVAMARRRDWTAERLIGLYEKSPVARHSAFQNMIARCRQIQTIPESHPRAQVRPMPQVQKPGTRNEDAVRESEYNNMEREFRGKSPNAQRGGKVGHCEEERDNELTTY